MGQWTSRLPVAAQTRATQLRSESRLGDIFGEFGLKSTALFRQGKRLAESHGLGHSRISSRKPNHSGCGLYLEPAEKNVRLRPCGHRCGFQGLYLQTLT